MARSTTRKRKRSYGHPLRKSSKHNPGKRNRSRRYKRKRSRSKRTRAAAPSIRRVRNTEPGAAAGREQLPPSRQLDLHEIQMRTTQRTPSEEDMYVKKFFEDADKKVERRRHKMSTRPSSKEEIKDKLIENLKGMYYTRLATEAEDIKSYNKYRNFVIDNIKKLGLLIDQDIVDMYTTIVTERLNYLERRRGREIIPQSKWSYV